MSLAEFKMIFWWEWGHRLLGRAIGAVFLLPFLVFLWRGWVGPGLRLRLWSIFALGGIQGAVGWWMVASGLADRVSVSQYRLAFHLTLACAIFVAVLWTAERLALRPAVAASRRLRRSAGILLGFILVQIYLGALVAGLRAGLVHNSWPLIDGAIVPALSSLLFEQPVWRNFFENPLTVQFDHRMAAYALWLACLLHAADAWRTGGAARGLALALAVCVTVQAALGIATLVYQVPILLALAHQGVAMLALGLATLHAARLTATAAAPARG